MRSADVSSDTATNVLCGCVAGEEQQDTRDNSMSVPRAPETHVS